MLYTAFIYNLLLLLGFSKLSLLSWEIHIDWLMVIVPWGHQQWVSKNFMWKHYGLHSFKVFWLCLTPV